MLPWLLRCAVPLARLPGVGLMLGLALSGSASAQDWSMTKTASPSTYTAAGTTITYTYVVTKLVSGPDTALNNIRINDDRLGVVCTGRSIPGDGAGGTTTCTANYVTTAADLAVAGITNTAAATGTISGDFVDLDPITANATITNGLQPSWTLSKTASPTAFTAAGQSIVYSYSLSNTGGIAISGIAVTDNKVAPVACPATVLAAGASMTCSATYTTTAADVAAGSVTNIATANGTPAFGALAPATAQATVTSALQPSWTLGKTASPATFTAAGQSIVYSYTVTNTGSTTISGIAVTDNKVAPVTCPATVLAGGASMTCSATYTTTAADVAAGSVTNVATANGTPGSGTLAPATAQATVTRVVATGSITIVKTSVGGNRTFSFSSSIRGTATFELSTAGGTASRTFTNLTAGTYSFTEDLPPSWRLTALSCSGDTGGLVTTTSLAARTVTVGLDGGESITCTFTNTFDAGAHIERTQGVIRSFLTRRIMLLAGSEPDRARFLRRMPGALWGDTSGADRADAAASPVTVSGSGLDSSSRMSLSTSLSQAQAYAKAKAPPATGRAKAGDPPANDFDIWFEAHFNHFDANAGGPRNRGHFNVAYAGADYVFGRSLLVGALVQVDWMGESSASQGTSAEGKGVMAGPYLGARLTPQLYFDARFAWGVSDNNVNPSNLYQDRFSTDRWLAVGRLTGNWRSGNVRVTPSASVTFVEETQRSYIDSLGFVIPSQTVSLGRLSAGPEIAYRMVGPGNSIYEPHVQLRGSWDFYKPGAGIVGGIAVGAESLRAQLAAGLLVRTRAGFNLRVTGQYDGIGSDSLRHYGGQIWVNVPFDPAAR